MTVVFGDTRLPPAYWDKVQPEPNTGHWFWTAGTNSKGYGTFRVGSKGKVYAHRIMAKLAYGPSELDALHRCGISMCVNPDCLYWGTDSENRLDSVRHGTHHHAKKTHCPQGHRYTVLNTYVYPKGRTCKQCCLDRNAARRKAGARQ